VKRSAHNPEITKITSEISGKYVEVDGIAVQGLLVEVGKGPMAFSLVAGRYPTAEGEIALGATTLAQAGAHIGSKVPVSIFNSTRGSETSPLKVVGTIAFPPEFGTGGFGMGAVATIATVENLACPAGPTKRACVAALNKKIRYGVGWEMAIGTAPGRRGGAVTASLESRFGSVLTPAAVPTDLVNFGQAVNFPALLGVTLAIFGAAALEHLEGGRRVGIDQYFSMDRRDSAHCRLLSGFDVCACPCSARRPARAASAA
jgi:hypothetical protein